MYIQYKRPCAIFKYLSNFIYIYRERMLYIYVYREREREMINIYIYRKYIHILYIYILLIYTYYIYICVSQPCHQIFPPHQETVPSPCHLLTPPLATEFHRGDAFAASQLAAFRVGKMGHRLCGKKHHV